MVAPPQAKTWLVPILAYRPVDVMLPAVRLVVKVDVVSVIVRRGADRVVEAPDVLVANTMLQL